ncbi:MAG: EpsG family protein [Clostridia bacterium]|nr:EpsG family protein [Clostridia bacterium]
MVLYSITYLLNMLGCYANKKTAKQLWYVVIILLVFMSGTRYYMGGNDVYVYEGTYNNAPSVDVVLKYLFTGINEGVNTNFDTGFILMCSIIKSIGFSYFGFMLIWAIIFYILMVNGLKEFVSDWAPFIAVFMYKIMFYDTFISIRQGMTIAMFCFMLRFIRDGKWYYYFPMCILAMLEHAGAVILIPLYFITHLPISKRFITIYSLALLPTFFISSYVDISDAIINVASWVGRSESSALKWTGALEKISFIHTLECYIIVALVLLFYDKIINNKKQKEAKLALQMLLIAVPMFTLFRDWIVLTREKDYFVMSYGLLMGYLFEGKTTSVLSYDNEEYGHLNTIGTNNFKIISLLFFAACLIGMIRFVNAFDGGVLRVFQTFILRDGVSLFRGW